MPSSPPQVGLTPFILFNKFQISWMQVIFRWGEIVLLFLDFLHFIQVTQPKKIISQKLLDTEHQNERKAANYIHSMIFPFQQNDFNS
ncbi:hypothetical protein L345_08314, partial [Ophiophagus hannah]